MIIRKSKINNSLNIFNENNKENGTVCRITLTPDTLKKRTYIDLLPNNPEECELLHFDIDNFSSNVMIKDALLNCLTLGIESTNILDIIYDNEDLIIGNILKKEKLKENYAMIIYLKISVRNDYSEDNKDISIKITYEYSTINKANIDIRKEYLKSKKSKIKPDYSFQPKMIRLTYAEALEVVKYFQENNK